MLAHLLVALLVVASSFSFASSEPSQSTADHHWLVGIWEGNLANWPQGSKAGQTMRVLSVAADGTAQGNWFTTGEDEYLATIKVTGARVQIMSNAYSVIDLTRQGDDELTGSFALAGGARYRIALKKLTVPSDPATDLLARKLVGRWEGTVELPPWERESARTLVIDSIQQKDESWTGWGRFGLDTEEESQR